MFYTTDHNKHGLPHNPFKGCILPRPIGWISTRSAAGVNNLAPYSFFNAVSSEPPMVMYTCDGAKDTLLNIEETGVFVVNVATYPLRHAMNASSEVLAPEVDEFVVAGVTATDCDLIPVPRVAECPIAMECRRHQIIELPSNNPRERHAMVLGHVIGIHIDEAVMTNGMVDPVKLQPLSRLGYRDYAVINEVFQMDRPAGGDAAIGQ